MSTFILCFILFPEEKCGNVAKFVLILQEMVEALKALSTFFVDNSLRSRRNLRGDIEKRSLAINESFEGAFRDVKQVDWDFFQFKNKTDMKFVSKLDESCIQ